MRIPKIPLIRGLFLVVTALVAALIFSAASSAQVTGTDWPMFGGDRMRTGWRSNETALTTANVSGGSFGQVWQSPQFDPEPDGNPGHAFANPVYINSVAISTSTYSGTFKVVFCSTTAGYAYAINAAQNGSVAAGTILWSTKLTTPAGSPVGDDVGNLSTPIVDTSASPPRMYVTSYDATNNWEAFALNISNGTIITGWPVVLSNTTVPAVNKNGSGAGFQNISQSQRGGLNLSPDGTVLYVDWGTYGDSGPGWLAAINTTTASLASSFSGSSNNTNGPEGGMWGSGGPPIDPVTGDVYTTLGNGTTAQETTAGFWGSSALQFKPGSTLALNGTYTPFDYCNLDANDVDVGAGSPMVVPTLSGTSTPDTIAFGGKQGNIYLVNRNPMPGTLTSRVGCSTNAAGDLSLLPPGNQPQFGTRGPLNVFGPYTETNAGGDYARARTTPAYFQANGTNYIVATGCTKASDTSTTCIAPDVVLLKIVTPSGAPAYLQVAASQTSTAMVDADSAIITSNGSSNPIIWILDSNLARSANPWTVTNQPILFALNALDPNLAVLYQTPTNLLDLGGKFDSPASGDGMIFVGTDRIQAFGITSNCTAPTAPSNLTATAQSSSQINLSWTASSSTCGVTYNVFRSTTSGFTPSSSNQIASGVTTTTYSDTGLVASATYYYLVEGVGAAGTSPASNQASATTQAGSGQLIAINSGGPLVSPFVADEDFTGGGTLNHANTIDTSKVTNPAPAAVYQTGRDGGFTYTIGGFTPGTGYVVRLHFCETYFATAGSRTFDVTINNTQVLTDFDIFATAGGKNIANIQQFTEPANSSGQFVIQFTSVVNSSLVSGIEIDSTSGGSCSTAPTAPSGLGATAISSSQINLSWTASTAGTGCTITYDVFRSTTSGFTPSSSNQIASSVTATTYSDTGLTASTTYYYLVEAVDSSGSSAASNQASATTSASSGSCTSICIDSGSTTTVTPFVADEDFSGGATLNHANTINTSKVTNPAPAAVYQTGRDGNFTYTIGGFTASSMHTVRLHFCETYFTASGKRTFNVSINSTQVLTDFDIFATAGGQNIANIQQFTEAANSSGQYVIQFTSVVNNSLVSGIEID